jgi:hypothetical protein
MAISSTTSRWEYTGDNLTTDFTYNNLIFATSDLEVYIDNILQTLTTHYTVSGVSPTVGGTVSFITAPGTDTSVIIIRVIADTQETVYPSGGSLPSGVIEDDLDRRTIVSQQQEEKLSRAMLSPSGEAQLDMTLPVIATRAGKYLGFDSNGQPVELTTPAGTTALSTYGTSLGTAADVTAAQSLFNINTDILTTGSSTVYVYTSAETITSYDDGPLWGVDFHTTCGAAPTINIDTVGAKALKWPNGTALTTGDVVTGQKAILAYDGTDMIVLTAGGAAASKNSGTATLTALPDTEDVQNQSAVYVADGGAASVYTISLTPAPSAYAEGQRFAFKATNANTGSSTLNVNTLGAKTIKKYKDGAQSNLETGDILASQMVDVEYDGTDFQMVSPVASLGIPVRVLDRNMAELSYASSTTETTIYSYSVPANTLGTNKALRITIGGNILANSGTDTLTIRIKYGATTMWDDSEDFAVTAVLRSFRLEAILAAGNSTSVQNLIGSLTSSSGVLTTGIGQWAGTEIGGTINGAATEDSTGALTLDITAEHSVNHANVDLTINVRMIELLP